MTHLLEILDELKAIRALLEEIKARMPTTGYYYQPIPCPPPPIWYSVSIDGDEKQ